MPRAGRAQTNARRVFDRFGSIDDPAGEVIEITRHAFKTELLDASFIIGAIALPMVVPRLVVKTTTVAPAATSP